MATPIKKLAENIAADIEKATDLPKEATLQEAWWLLEHVTHKKKWQLLLATEDNLDQQSQATLAQCLHERTTLHKPLQYILGSVPFIDCTITVEPPTLIPRPETEEWTAWLINHIKQVYGSAPPALSILDLCAGSGCIAIALAKAFPTSQLIATDIAPTALRLIQKNKRHNNTPNVTACESHLFSALTNYQHHFDIIVSNPPYIAQKEWYSLSQSVRLWEDPAALVANNDGLALYEKIINEARSYLRPTEMPKIIPSLVLEIGSTQAGAITKLLEDASFTKIVTHQDIESKDRWISAYF